MSTVLIIADNGIFRSVAGILGKGKQKYQVVGFDEPSPGLEYAQIHQPHIILLDTQVQGKCGIELGTVIRKALPDAAIIYISQNPDLAFKAYSTYPSDYLLKPVDETRLRRTLERIAGTDRILPPEQPVKHWIRCFGSFKVFSGQEELHFPTQKTRELLAFLLCHLGEPYLREDMARILFEKGDDKKNSNNFRVTMFRLRQTLKELEFEKNQLLLKEDCTIEIEDGICDMVDFLRFCTRSTVIDDSNIGEARRIIGYLHGDPFSDLDSLWVTESRVMIIEKIETLILKTAAYYLTVRETYTEAEQILLLLLEINELSELGYSALLDHYIDIGDKTKYIQLYRRYAKMLKVDLGIKPERRLTECYIRFARTPNALEGA